MIWASLNVADGGLGTANSQHSESVDSMEVSEVALNGAKRFAGITILDGYNANISIVAALWADSDGTRDASR
jgi:hypothetical protein